MLWAAAESVGTQYASAVHLFQSSFFKEEDFPQENKYFANVTYTKDEGDLASSLATMRLAMLTSEPFEAAVFIGGMDGIFDEAKLFEKHCPNARMLPLAISGGASRTLAQQLGYVPPANLGPFDFVRLFYRELGVSPRQQRAA